MANKDKNEEVKPLSNYDKMVICEKAYKYMFVDEVPEKFQIHFICVAIEKFLPESMRKLKAYEAIPELLEYNPAGKVDGSHWWPWNEDGMKIRKDVLSELIQRFRLSED